MKLNWDVGFDFSIEVDIALKSISKMNISIVNFQKNFLKEVNLMEFKTIYNNEIGLKVSSSVQKSWYK